MDTKVSVCYAIEKQEDEKRKRLRIFAKHINMNEQFPTTSLEVIQTCQA